MLGWSFALLLLAALLGGGLAAPHFREGARPPAWWLGVLHGVLGAAGFAVLLLALRGPPRDEALGVAGFGRIAAWLLVLALLAGLGVAAARLWRRGAPALLIGGHATLAICGVVVLAAYVLAGQ